MSHRRGIRTDVAPSAVDAVYAAYQADPVFAYLRAKSTRFVPGVGNAMAPDLMFVGEAPGKDEDEQGMPFVGEAGRVLNHLLALIGVGRESVWITNLVKYRPPNNNFDRVDPEALAAATRYLVREVDVLNPGLIVLLGNRALRCVFPNERIGRVHGDLLNKGGYRFFAAYHPANGVWRPEMMDALESDFRALQAVR